MKKTLILLFAFAVTTLYAEEPYESVDAELKGFEIIDQQHAKFTLDFIHIFYTGSDKQYQRYLKLGYPKITQEEFDAKDPDGLFIMNTDKKLTELTTNADTTYEAICINSKHSNREGYVSLSLSEFSEIIDKKYGYGDGRKAVVKKHGFCYSKDGSILKIKIDGNLLKHVSFEFMPPTD